MINVITVTLVMHKNERETVDVRKHSAKHKVLWIL